MPELPEVETVINTLRPLILNKKIVNINVYYDKIIQNTTRNDFIETLTNETFTDIKRIGKHIILIFKNNILLVHLRMEGRFYYLDNEPMCRHEHICFTLEDGKTLRFIDTRKFGTMHLFKTNDINEVVKHEPLNKLGIDPTFKELTIEYLKPLFNRNVSIKTLLLDQSIICGIGNIYADEICYWCKINPLTVGKKLTDEDILHIIYNTNIVFKKAISLGGSTIKSFESGFHISGRFQNELKVHGLTNCKTCGEVVIHEKVNGRMTYYCPRCQGDKK